MEELGGQRDNWVGVFMCSGGQRMDRVSTLSVVWDEREKTKGTRERLDG